MRVGNDMHLFSHTQVHLYFYCFDKMGYKSHSTVSLQATKPKCVAMSLMQPKWKGMRMAGRAVPKHVKGEGTENRERNEGRGVKS